MIAFNKPNNSQDFSTAIFGISIGFQKNVHILQKFYINSLFSGRGWTYIPKARSFRCISFFYCLFHDIKNSDYGFFKKITIYKSTLQKQTCMISKL